MPLSAHTATGQSIEGIITSIIGEDIFIFKPGTPVNIEPEKLIKVSDGRDSVLAKVIESTKAGIRLSIETQAKPPDERREDVRINDKIFYKATLLGHVHESEDLISSAMTRIHSEKLIINSFIKGRYGMTGSDDAPYSHDAQTNQEVWELNRKLDLLIYMFLTDEFKNLIRSTPKEVNISAAGIRFISQTPLDVMDIIELHMALPMSPLLYIRVVSEVIRVKTLAVEGREQHSIVARFLHMDPETKEDIVHYIFKRQRELLRRRLEFER
ncbi:MAG TPA: PilZ domain-containing protein [Desulfomonilia bacterium]